MNAHAHTDFTENARDSRGRFLKSEAHLPGDRYVLEIIGSDVVHFGDMTELQFRAQIVEGMHKGRVIDFKQRITAEYEIADEDYKGAERYGGPNEQEFVALRSVTNVRNLRDTEELHSKPFSALVGYENGLYRVFGFERVAADQNASKPTPARGPDGRFLPRQDAKPEAEVEQDFAADVAAWTPEQSFMFRLEGDLYQLTALSAMLETLLTPITHKMAGYDRPASAALDYAVTNLADAVREIEERYMAVRFPEKAEAA